MLSKAREIGIRPVYVFLEYFEITEPQIVKVRHQHSTMLDRFGTLLRYDNC